jgi:hypothetical protein
MQGIALLVGLLVAFSTPTQATNWGNKEAGASLIVIQSAQRSS